MPTLHPRQALFDAAEAAAAALPVGCAGPQFVPPPAGAIRVRRDAVAGAPCVAGTVGDVRARRRGRP